MLRHVPRPFRRLSITLVILLLIGCALITIRGLHDDLGQADVGLVLGARVELNGQPSPPLKARLRKAAQLYRAGYFQTLIASGGIGKEGYDESIVMRDYLTEHGVPEAHIIMDNQGLTTFDSARNFAKLYPNRETRVLVISQYFHTPRARLALRCFGYTKVYTAHPSWFEWRDIYSVPREVLGYIAYSLRSLFPTAALPK